VAWAKSTKPATRASIGWWRSRCCHRLADSAAARDRFELEARAISKLSHPNICAIFDVGRAGELSYLVLELLEGKPLTTLIARGPMPTASILIDRR
jgi:serine/threonine-protein kinase